jgi:Cap4 SAVED domain
MSDFKKPRVFKFGDHCQRVAPNTTTTKTKLVPTIFKVKSGERATFTKYLGSALVVHYVGVSALLKSGGFTKAAALIEASVPTDKRIQTRSGDLGEMLATEYLNAETDYRVPFNKLQWKSDREMPMHGNDVIGLNGKAEPTRVLKAETKSRITFTPSVMTEAIEALDGHSDRPNPSSMAFIIKRLFELGRDEEAASYSQLLTQRSLDPSRIEHHLFVLCGNDPTNTLSKVRKAKRSGVKRSAAALIVDDHQQLVSDVFRVALNGK